MLVLSRKASESFFIGNDIEIIVTEIGAERVKIGIRAPKGVPVLRRELLETRDLNREANSASDKGAVNELKKLVDRLEQPPAEKREKPFAGK
ncbi:MAG: carbon storage regulator [Oscillospiraceae bacterium]|jgi:carbon storage regulator|nr:carbon storage regulator [Oscillospiraceae bacterium]MCI1990349.1 carbon storage regulator [Oscillospiraceae bacterium]MCI2034454.1 carbon storage regulator [Oscillospiraceae bacterium]